MMTMVDAFNEAAIAQLLAAAPATGPFAGALLGLFTNNITPTRSTILADLVEAAYAGYARQAGVYSVPGRDQNGNIGSFTTRLIWQETGGPTAVNVYGIFLVDSTGMILYGAELFDTPITLTTLLDYIATVTEFLGTGSGTGFTTVVE